MYEASFSVANNGVDDLTFCETVIQSPLVAPSEEEAVQDTQTATLTDNAGLNRKAVPVWLAVNSPNVKKVPLGKKSVLLFCSLTVSL